LDKTQFKGYTNTFDSYDSPILVHPGAYFFPKSVENRAFLWGLPILAIYDTIKRLLTN